MLVVRYPTLVARWAVLYEFHHKIYASEYRSAIVHYLGCSYIYMFTFSIGYKCILFALLNMFTIAVFYCNMR